MATRYLNRNSIFIVSKQEKTNMAVIQMHIIIVFTLNVLPET